MLLRSTTKILARAIGRLVRTLPPWQNPESRTDLGRKYIPSGMPPTGHQVSPERLEEFRRIYKEVYGEEITSAEASAMTHRLLALYRLLSRPLPGDTSSSLLLRHHLRFKTIPKCSDIIKHMLTFFGLRVVRNCFANLAKRPREVRRS
jgi:hypothetical protein